MTLPGSRMASKRARNGAAVALVIRAVVYWRNGRRTEKPLKMNLYDQSASRRRCSAAKTKAAAR